MVSPSVACLSIDICDLEIAVFGRKDEMSLACLLKHLFRFRYGLIEHGIGKLAEQQITKELGDKISNAHNTVFLSG